MGDDRLEAITKRALRSLADKSGRWLGFASDPAETAGNESEVFKPLQNIINGILNLVDENQLLAVCDGNATPYSSRDDRSRPDGWLKMSKSRIPHPPSGVSDEPDPRWDDIVCPLEFKKSSDSRGIEDVRFVRINFGYLIY
jgi:hypothetical protein